MMTPQANDDGYGEVLAHVIGILQEITADWDVGEISAGSRLATLNLESINLVYFIAELQQKYALQQQLFTRIRAADRPLADLRVADVVDFVREMRGAREPRREEPPS
jgi:acyl carrier protein